MIAERLRLIAITINWRLLWQRLRALVMFRFSSGNTPGFILIFFCFGRRDIFCLRLSEENYPKVNLVPDVPDISILCRRTEEVPRTSIKSEFLPRKKKTLLCCGRNSISYQSRYHFQIKNIILWFQLLCSGENDISSFLSLRF